MDIIGERYELDFRTVVKDGSSPAGLMPNTTVGSLFFF